MNNQNNHSYLTEWTEIFSQQNCVDIQTTRENMGAEYLVYLSQFSFVQSKDHDIYL